MIHRKVGFAVLVSAVILALTSWGIAQSGGTIAAGTTVKVRTVEDIQSNRSDGRIFPGVVDEDVRDTRGSVALPAGTDVELLVRNSESNQLVLDLDSVTISGNRFGIETGNTVVNAEQKEGIGANSRTGKYVGGGAVIGAIVGAIAGGGKGAAIGGGVGAAAGAGAQIATRGRNVSVPAETLVTFRLEQPLRTGVSDTGFSRNGYHYHQGYGTTQGNSSPYDAGIEAGRADRKADRTYNKSSTRWSGADLKDYQDGYTRGFDESPDRAAAGAGSIRIGADHYVTWKGPAASQVFVQVDNNPRRIFSRDASGSQAAPWIAYGHRYVFTLEDPNGKEIARDENDLRRSR